MAGLPSVQSSCDFLLHSVRSSGLNFSCQETPFSLFLTLRKSFVKTIKPPNQTQIDQPEKFDVKEEKLTEENNSLKKALNNLKRNYEDAIIECESHCQGNDVLKKKIAILDSKLTEEKLLTQDLDKKNKALEKALEMKSNEQNRIIDKYEKEISKQKDISMKLNTEISDIKKKHGTTKDEITRDFKKEIKLIKKDLGQERKEKLKLEKKLQENDFNSNDNQIDDQSVSQSSSSTNVTLTATTSNLISPSASISTSSIDSPNASILTSNLVSPTANNSTSSMVHNNNSSIENIAKGFEEFLGNFKDNGNAYKYEVLARDVVKSGKCTLNVSISDIRSHNKLLKESINLHYTKVYPHLCNSLRTFIKSKVGTDEATENFLVRLV